MKFGISAKRGQAVMTLVVFAMLASLGGLLGFSHLALRESGSSREMKRAEQSLYLSEAGMEDVAYRIRAGKQYGSIEILTLGGFTATTTTIDAGAVKEILAEGNVERGVRSNRAVVRQSVTDVSFYYGVQVGDGGLQMKNNSAVNGSVYSNGSITGAAGAAISGDAIVAEGNQTSVVQSWETQNADYGVGISSGAILTTVDSAGNVGDYNSLALGQDGFGRVSYIDRTNGDLKFAQCLNDGCSSAARVIVDSVGYIDEVTSLIMGPDDRGRISYYHDGNDDLKYARCVNADCSGTALTVVESSGNVGDFSDIEIGSDGFARIAYWQDNQGDAKFARCTNADCTASVRTVVESSGSVGEYISLELGSDGFGRMSYYDSSNGDLKFTRCTNADCTAKTITVVDSAGIVGQYTSLALGSDGFARISYYDSSNGDLKFARCTNADCTAKVITVVDAVGTVGQYTSLALGSDGFARISYYDSSNGDLKFARCVDADCAASGRTTVDAASSVGKPSSLALGQDGFGRISYYAAGAQDLKYARCVDDICTPPDSRIDVAQSFWTGAAGRIVQVDVFLKKVGSPANATLRLMRDVSGSPSVNPADALATASVNAASVGTAYGWHGFILTPKPTLAANARYWIVIDAALDGANYLVWGGDANAGYANGSAKKTDDWTLGGWQSIGADLDFRVRMGGTNHVIDSVAVGNASVGTAWADEFIGAAVRGAACPNQYCITTQPQPALAMPIPDSVMVNWKNDAVAGGTCVPPVCTAAGDFILNNGESANLGPQKITGKLILSNNATLTVTGTLWVLGNIELSNNCVIRLTPAYGALSGIIITDAKLVISNNCVFGGSGNPASFVLVMSEKDSPLEEIMTVDNNSVGVVYYADRGRIKFSNNAAAKEATAYGITLDNSATITYDSGLANMQFSSGPAGGYEIRRWKEVE